MRRVVITGMGITSGIGNDLKTFASNLFEMNAGFREIDTFDTSSYRFKFGSTVQGIDERIPRGSRRLPRPIKFLINATQEALAMSGVLEASKYGIDPRRIGTYIAGPACSIFEVENYYRDYVSKGLDQTDPMDLAYANMDSAVNEVGRQFSLLGPRNTILTACSSSGVAIGLAADLIRLGEVDAMLAGGTDGFSEFTFSGFQSLQSISPEPCRPFDRNRMGLSFGEGAGVLILEDYERAKARGAQILGEIAGYGAVGEGYNLTAPHPDALGYIKTMSRALKAGGVNPEQVGYVNAHGTATSLNDSVEGKAIRTVFGNHELPVNSIKSLVGHCMGAAGAVEAVNSVLTILHNAIPGTKNCTEPDQEIGIRVAQQTMESRFDYVICNSAGFGGNNSSVLFKRFVA